jgi:hypothetical protein
MRCFPPRSARPGTGLSRRAVSAGLLLAAVTAVTAAAGGPAAAAALSGTSPALRVQQLALTSAGNSSPPGKVTWSVMPATATGTDKTRVLFNYATVKPGSTIIDHVEIVNDSKQSAAFSIYGTDATGTSQSDALLLMPPGQKPVDIGHWVTFPGGAAQLSTIIPGGKAIVAMFTIKVPLQATPGDHTGGMVAQVGIPRKNSAGLAVVENYRIAVPIELRVPGALHSGLQVESISTGFSDPLNPFGTGSATVSYSVANTGNVRLAGSQAVTVSGPFGQQVSVKLPQLPTILPGDSVRFTAQAPGLFPAGPMTGHVSVTPSWPARAQPLNTQLVAATGSASLFAMPWSLLGLFLLLIAIGVGVWWFLRWRRREHRAEVAAAAARARRDTERRLLGTPAAGSAAPVPAEPASASAPSSGPEPDPGSTTE